MKRLMDNGQAEIAPLLIRDEECGYLPLFGVYQPQKRDQVRVVFIGETSRNFFKQRLDNWTRSSQQSHRRVITLPERTSSRNRRYPADILRIPCVKKTPKLIEVLFT